MTLEQFKQKYLGKQVEYHSYGPGALNQCTDLVNAYINECLDSEAKDYTEIIGTNAKDFKDNFDPEDFDFIANTTTPNVMPERGDIAVFNGRVGGGAGHVSIILEAGGMDFRSLDQNWSKIERVTEEEHKYNNVSGWLRPKGNKICEKQIKRLEEKIEALKDKLKQREEVGEVEYPKWKKVLWRFGRVFLAAFLGSVAINVKIIKSLEDLYPLLVLPAIIAGINAVAKALREYIASEEYNNLIHKLPI